MQTAAKSFEVNASRNDGDDDGMDVDDESNESDVSVARQLLAETRRERTQSRSVFSSFTSL